MNIRIQYVILGIALWCANAAATVVAPKFEKDFNKLIDASNLAVVHFVDYDLIDKNTDESKQAAQKADDVMEDIEDVKEEFADVADDEDFEGVRFIGVDLRALPDLADDYNITELSTIMLFKDGKPFKRRGEIVTLKGIVDSEEIDDFIMDHFEDFIEKLQAPTQAVRPTTQRTVVYQPYEQRYYSRPYYGRTWYRPYWRRGYYNRFGSRPYYWRHGGRWGGRRRGGFGFGIGFGGGRRGRGGFGFGGGFGGRRGRGGFGIGW